MAKKKAADIRRFDMLVGRMTGAEQHPQGVLIPNAELADVLALAGAIHAVYMGRMTATEAIGAEAPTWPTDRE